LISATNRGSKAQVYTFEEDGKKVYGIYWFITYPGEENKITLKYKVNKVLSDNFNFVFQKQAGIISNNFSYNLKTKNGKTLVKDGKVINQYDFSENLVGDFEALFGLK
jgi:hypothetical protein